MKQKIKNILKRFVPLMLIAFWIGISIYNINSRFVLGNKLPMPFGIGTSVVLSGSMEPELSGYDLIIVKEIKETDQVFEDQVIVYQSGSALTVHRIMEINGEEIITQGDANNKPDDPITRDMIKAEVLFAVPLIGAVVCVLKMPVVMVVLLCFAVWLLERSFRIEKAKEQKEMEALKDEIKELMDELKK